MKRIEYDVVIVGGGPAGLSAAHRLADRAKAANTPLRMAVFEKGKDFGAHILSGAVSNPRSVKKLFPDYETNGFPLEGKCTHNHLTLLGREKAADMPFYPPEMNKTGYLILSLSAVCKWMADNLVEKTKDSSVVVDLYAGFPAIGVLYEGDRVAGVRVDNSGDPARDNCHAKVTVFGDKAFLSRDVITKHNLLAANTTFAVGVKEVWETEKDYSGHVWHTLGYPLLDGSFGGGFIYGLKDKKIAIGMVAGLDTENPNMQPPQILQALKKHPMVQEMIKGGHVVRYGASVIPEGGFFSMPKELALDGAVIVGDAAGVMDIKGFSGVDKAMESGMAAADAVFDALAKNDVSAAALGAYKRNLMDGWVGSELKAARYYRHAFHEHKSFFRDYLPAVAEGVDRGSWFMGGVSAFFKGPGGMISSGLGMLKLMGGGGVGELRPPEDRTYSRPDHKAAASPSAEGFVKNTIFSTADVVFYANTHYHHGNRHIDEFNAEVCRACIRKYEGGGNPPPCVGDCTAEVHEVVAKDGARTHHMNLENCVQCRTCEIVCPDRNLKVNPAEHGSGPDFTGL